VARSGTAEKIRYFMKIGKSGIETALLILDCGE
jgi:hypothetical protein